jgi:hypothetical protein
MSGEDSPNSDSDYSIINNPRSPTRLLLDDTVEEESEPELESETEGPESAIRELYREFGFDYNAENPPVNPSLSQPDPMTNPSGSQNTSRSGPPQASLGTNQGNPTSSSQPTMSSTTTTTNPVTVSTNITVAIGTEKIEYNPGGIASKTTEAFYKKQDREPMAPDKLAALFEKATKPGLTAKFDLISPTFNDANKLDDTYSTGILINRFKSHCIKYDMCDVMTVVYLQPNKSRLEKRKICSSNILRYQKESLWKAMSGIENTQSRVITEKTYSYCLMH